MAEKAAKTKAKTKNQKKLVIVESPTKAHTIGRFLKGGYMVDASEGHVRDLPKSRIAVDVLNGFEPEYINIRGKGDLIKRLKKEAQEAGKVYLATDPDREGEAISWHLGSLLGIEDSKINRIEFHEITQKAVTNAIKAPRTLDMGLINAQQARRVLDRLVGYKISPILWTKVKKGLSAGRVQSVAQAMICSREQEIDAFIPEEFWTITGVFKYDKSSFKARFYGFENEKFEPKSKEEADNVIALAKLGNFTVSQVKYSSRKKNPAPPFTTSTLQQEAARKLNFSTSKTMRVAQELFEGVDLGKEGTQGLVTYIRTDSTRISPEAIEGLRGFIKEHYGSDYLPKDPITYKSRKNAQDAHEAIRPTEINRLPADIQEHLTRDQLRLYKLIFERFVSSQMEQAVYDTLQADITNSKLSFKVSGQRMSFPGFTKVYEESLDVEVEDNEMNLPKLVENTAAELTDIMEEQRFTQPPPRYTEASLVRALEENGIGRPSTYAPTITTIMQRGYIAKEKKRLMPTELGNVVNDIMCEYFPDIVSIEFTAKLEEELDKVEAGEKDWHQVVSAFYPAFEESLKNAEGSLEKIKVEDEISDVPCKECGTLMVYKRSRFGKFLACPNFPDCRYTQTIQKAIDVPCPKCGGNLIEKVSRKGRRFYGCDRYPECDTVFWDKPVNQMCPKCKTQMVLKFGANGVRYHLCSNEGCRNKITIENAGENENE